MSNEVPLVPEEKPREEATGEVSISSTIYATVARTYAYAPPARFQASFPVWRLWAEIAIDHYHLANLHREEGVTARREQPDQSAVFGNALYLETKAAMIAVAAAMHAIDGFYGSTKEFVEGPASARIPIPDTWSKKSKSRPSRIFRTLIRGFAVGAKTNTWPSEAKELFNFRDDAVHSQEKPRDTKLHGTGVATAPEHVAFSLETAKRSVTLLLDVLSTCQSNPRPQYPQLMSYMDRFRHDIELLSERLNQPPTP